MTTERFLPDWFSLAEVQQLVSCAASGGISLRFVGGCVRDALLGRRVGDIDLATSALPETVMAHFSAAGYRTLPTGLKHGTVTVIIGARAFEITTLRLDTSCDGRHASVTFTDNWEADALRRDFTMNALMLSPDGILYDVTGGKADALAGYVRFIGNPHTRITEDYLRILRFFRFYATHGKGEADATALSAIQSQLEGLKLLSAERIQQEMQKILAAPAPLASLQLMEQIGVLPCITDQNTADISCLTRLLALPDANQHAWARLLALYGDKAFGIAKRWKCSTKVQHLLHTVPMIPLLQDRHQATLAHYRYPVEYLQTAYDLQRAKGNTSLIAHSLLTTITAPVFPVTGEMLQAIGIPTGKIMGEILRQLEETWIASDFTLNAEALLARVPLHH